MDSHQLFKVVDFAQYQGSIDTYCLECKDKSIFTVKSSDLLYVNPSSLHINFKNPYINTVVASCSRKSTHLACYIFRISEVDGITKIGQYPSTADASKQDLKAYGKVLSEEHQEGLAKAIGLFSYGIGAGSIVYLRKIFEALVEEAHLEASKNTKWIETHGENYPSLRMGEKVSSLGDFLPSDLVKHPKLYGFLSQGLHSLPENECLRLFPMLKLAIEFILGQKIDKFEKEQQRQTLQKLLNSTQV